MHISNILQYLCQDSDESSEVDAEEGSSTSLPDRHLYKTIQLRYTRPPHIIMQSQRIYMTTTNKAIGLPRQLKLFWVLQAVTGQKLFNTLAACSEKDSSTCSLVESVFIF